MESAGKQGMLVPQLIHLLGDYRALVCGLPGSVCIGCHAIDRCGIHVYGWRNAYSRYFETLCYAQCYSLTANLLGKSLVLCFIVLAALIVATTSSDALVLLGGLAVAYGFQMWPSLIAVCWWPWLTRQGVVIGLIAGLIAVTLTESIGSQYMPWGRWPFTIHSAGWGIFF